MADNMEGQSTSPNTPKAKPVETDPLAGGKEVKSNQVKFSKVGDYIIGFYQDKRPVTTANGTTVLYQLRGVLGQYHGAETTMDENGNKVIKVDKEPTAVITGDFYFVWGGKNSIDDGFRKAKPGQQVGIQFREAHKAKKAGNSPFKVFKFVTYDEMDPELIYEESETDIEIGWSRLWLLPKTLSLRFA